MLSKSFNAGDYLPHTGFGFLSLKTSPASKCEIGKKRVDRPIYDSKEKDGELGSLNSRSFSCLRKSESVLLFYRALPEASSNKL